MFIKFFTFLFVLLWCTVILAQTNDVDPNGDPSSNFIDTPGDVLYGWDIDALTGETGNLGVEYANGYLWVTARGLISPLGNKVVKIDVTDPFNPVVVDSMSQGTTSAWGWRDMAYDGTFLYGSDSDSMVQFDPVTMTVTGSLPGVNNPNRALAWDPATDHFWTASFTSDMWEFDRTGAIINQFPSATSMYGAGWDNWSADGPWLWANGGTGTNVIQVDPVTGLATGLSYWVSGSSDGGLDIDVDLVPGKIVAISLVQGSPDSVYVIEIGDYSSGPVCTWLDDFEAGTGNWTITNDGGTCVWEIHDASEYMLGSTGAAGNVLAADADFCGSGTTTLTTATLNTPIDASISTLVMLDFDHDWQAIGSSDFAYVDVSTDGGATWQNVVTYDVVDVRDTHESFDISGLVAGTSFLIRLVSVQPGWDWWWAVDNICVFADPVPVELTSFVASVNGNNVTLNWETATETNNQGFEIERNSGNGFAKIGYVAGFGTTTEIHTYSFVDASVNEGSYSYRLKQLDFNGRFEYSDVIEIDVTVPDVFALEQNYPNPFNPSTKINFSLAIDSKVNLKVFDILGQEVATLINSNLVAGSHNVDFDASLLNSGVYFYRIEATGIDGTNFTNVKKMILTK